MSSNKKLNVKPQVSSELSRELSLFHVTMMGLGMMIGAGVFLGTGKAIGYAGPGGVLITFSLNGIIALFTAMSYAELSSAIPRAGGAYNFARLGFGRGPSFIAGWIQWFASCIAGSLYAVCFATYTIRFSSQLGIISVPGESKTLMIKAVAIAISLMFLYINYRGASETGKIGAILTLLQTAFLVFIGGMGIWVAVREPTRLHNFEPFLNWEHGGWPALLVTMGFTAVAFEGYEVIAQAGDETIEARKNIPKAMLYSVLIVTVTYVACAFATVVSIKTDPGGLYHGIAPWKWIGNFGGEGFGEAIELLLPRFGKILIVLAVIFASTSALNATIYSATRAAYALGRDRMLPPALAKISKRNKTPWVALFFTGLIVLLFSSCIGTEQVVSSASIMFLFLFFFVNICVIKIRYNMGDELQYGFIMPFFPFLPILAIITQGLLAFFLYELGKTAWIIAPVWIGSGVLVYLFYSKSRATVTEDEIQTFEEETITDGDGYNVMVCVANPHNALSLINNSYKICRAKQAKVELLHMLQVPDQVSLSDASNYIDLGKEAIGEIMIYLAPFFPIQSTIRYCRNIPRGIITSVREKKTDLLIMGWQGRPKSHLFTLGNIIDKVLERVPCNVVIFKKCENKKFARALVPIVGGPNSKLALEIAATLVDQDCGEIVAFTVNIGNGDSPFNVGHFVEKHVSGIPIPQDKIHIKEIKSDAVERTIINEIHSDTEQYDLVVLGCTRQPLLQQIKRDPIPETIAKKCSKPLVMVHSTEGIRSWIKRWI